MEPFKHLATTLANQNSILEEMKSRLKPENACYHSVQNSLSSSLLSKNLKIMIHRTIILPVVYGCETWSLTLKKEIKPNVLENRVLRRIFVPKRDEITSGGNYLVRSLRICTPHQIFFARQIKKNEKGGACSTYVERRGAYWVFVGKPEGKRPVGRVRCR